MAKGVMRRTLDPGVERGGGDYEDLMPEHLLHMGLKYLASYARSRKQTAILLTVYPNGDATIWGNEDVRHVVEIQKRISKIAVLAERGMGEWGQPESQ